MLMYVRFKKLWSVGWVFSGCGSVVSWVCSVCYCCMVFVWLWWWL